MIIFDSIRKYCETFNNKSEHPLIQVVDLNKSEPIARSKFRLDFYGIFLKETLCGDLRYGNQYYDYAEGTMIFIGPGQVITNEPEGELHQPYGKAIVFHPDLLHKTSLASQMVNYNFFSYQSNEALHLSDRERGMVEACFENVKVEIIQNIDKHSKQLIVANIELLLKYCTRFYERQFITREHVNDGLLLNFENHLKVYFGSDQLKNYGIPSVVYFAEKLNLSPNYFGDLVKKETGKSPLEFIHLKLMEMAKIKVMDTSKSISDISFELGFKYPQHFTRFFKQHTGQSPKEYRTV